MQLFKQHIALFLLINFLFPQVASSIHYSWVSHTLIERGGLGYSKPDSGLQYHSCSFHLSGSSPFLLVENDREIVIIQNIKVARNYCSLEHYVHQRNYNFQLRGPPPG